MKIITSRKVNGKYLVDKNIYALSRGNKILRHGWN